MTTSRGASAPPCKGEALMKRYLSVLLLSAVLASPVQAQTSPNLTYNQVLTPAQWNQLFQSTNQFISIFTFVV
jgi:hypothetical protein